MSKTLESITQDVLELSQTQRLALARFILDLEGGPSQPGADAAWEEEISARIRAYDKGHLETMDYADFRQEMERRFDR